MISIIWTVARFEMIRKGRLVVRQASKPTR